jgi:hypothetical protein
MERSQVTSTSGLNITQNVRMKLIHDLTPCGEAERFMRAFGMIPGSPEVEEMEHRASHVRLNATAPVNQVLQVVAGLAGEVVGRCILENQGVDPDPELVASYQKVAMASSQAVVAHMLEMDLLHIGGHES